MAQYQIESRWPKWSNWRKVLASPHGERRKFNGRHELVFDTFAEVVEARRSLKQHNVGEYRIVV